MALLTSNWFIDGLSIFVIIISAAYFYLTRKFNYWKTKGITYEKPVVLFGSFKDIALFRTSIGEYLASIYRKTTSPYHGLFALDQPLLLLKDPAIIKSVLVKDFNYFNDRAIASNERDDLIGTHNLFFMKNPDWKSMRVKLSPVYSSGKIKLMFNLMNDIGSELGKYIDRVVSCNQDSIEVKEICMKYTTDVITSCAFGIQSNCLANENAKFRQIVKKIFRFTYSRSLQMNSYFYAPALVKAFRLKFFDPECAEFLRTVFNESLHHREETEIKRNDLIDILVDIKKKDSSLKDDKLVAQAAGFFSAGFESSSSLMSFIMYEISLNLSIQSKLRNEIISVLKKNNEILTYECIQDMQYLDMVCSESLRKYPPLPFLDRMCMQDYTLPGTDIVLDAGTPIYIPLLGLHYDPKYFPEPDKFDPKRFSEENKRSRRFAAYMPFGEGPRNCIGSRFGLINSKVGLVHILSRFAVEKTTKTPTKMCYDPKGFLVIPIKGIQLKFTRCDDGCDIKDTMANNIAAA